MYNPLVSVIIPVYNAEKYLDRCVESLCKQTYENIEVVLVDDESKDSSGKICDEWVEKDSRVKVIHKSNAGAGYARNTGIEAAEGEYIAYADADDYLLENAIEKAVTRIIETEADVCYYGCIDIGPDGERYGIPPKKLLYNSDETIEYVKNILGQSPDSTTPLFGGVSPWSGIVKKELLINNDVRFPSERECLSEDTLYNVRVCMNAHRIAVEPSCLYCYCHNDNSTLSSSYKSDRFEAAKKMYDILKDEVSSIKDDEIQQRLYRMFMQNLIACMKREIVYEKQIGKNNMWSNLRRMVNDSFVKECMSKYPIYRLPLKQRLLFTAIKYRNVRLVYILVSLRMK